MQLTQLQAILVVLVFFSLGDLIASNRKILEDVQYRVRKLETAQGKSVDLDDDLRIFEYRNSMEDRNSTQVKSKD